MLLFYAVSLGLTKTSIVLLYRSILPPGPSRTANYILLALVIACNVFAVIMNFVTCIPLQALWDEDVQGRCMGPAISLVLAIGNIVTDFMIFTLPLPTIVRLKMHWKKKAGLILVFGLGFVWVCPCYPPRPFSRTGRCFTFD